MYLKRLVLVAFVTTVVSFPTEMKENAASQNISVRYCQPQTPCGWKIHNHVDNTEVNLRNDYCECRPGQKCELYESRGMGHYVEYRCKLTDD